MADQSDSHVAVLALTGEIDIGSESTLEAILDEFVASGRQVVLDVRGVEFIDSTGLRLLIGVDGDLRRDGRRLVIRHPSAAVNRILEMTALERYLQIER